MYRQNTCSYQNSLVIAVTTTITLHKGSSSACQNKVILINKSLPVGRFKAPMPVKGLMSVICPWQNLVSLGVCLLFNVKGDTIVCTCNNMVGVATTQ